MKQKLILAKGTARVKTGFLRTKQVKGYVVIKAVNFVAEPFYLKEDLDILTDMGIQYEVKF